MRITKSSLLAGVEGTYGVDPTLVAGAATSIEVDNLNIVPISEETVPRSLVRPFLGHAELLQAAKWKQVSFSVPIAGSGAAGTAPKWGKLLRGCSMSETVNAGVSVVYKHIEAAEESVAFYGNYDGQLEKALGARGTFSWNFRARQRPTFDFSFMCLFVAIADAALPAIDLTGWILPVAVNNANTPTFSLHGYAAKMLEFVGQAGVENEYRNLVGMEQVDPADRNLSASVTFEPPTIAAKDYFSIVNSKATGALQLVHGPATNQVKFDMAATQLHTPERVTNGKFRYNKFGVHPVATASGNDMTITAL